MLHQSGNEYLHHHEIPGHHKRHQESEYLQQDPLVQSQLLELAQLDQALRLEATFPGLLQVIHPPRGSLVVFIDRYSTWCSGRDYHHQQNDISKYNLAYLTCQQTSFNWE